MLCVFNLDFEKIIGNLFYVNFKRNFSQKQPNWPKKGIFVVSILRDHEIIGALSNALSTDINKHFGPVSYVIQSIPNSNPLGASVTT